MEDLGLDEEEARAVLRDSAGVGELLWEEEDEIIIDVGEDENENENENKNENVDEAPGLEA